MLTGRRGRRKLPLELEVVVAIWPVAMSLVCSFAPWIAAPIRSVTVPPIAPSTAVWAWAVRPRRTKTITHSPARPCCNGILSPGNLRHLQARTLLGVAEEYRIFRDLQSVF